MLACVLTACSCTGEAAGNAGDPASVEHVVTNLLRCALGDCAEASATNAVPGTAATPSAPSIVLFRTTTTQTGNLMANGGGANGRQGADNLCITARSGLTFTPSNVCASVRAFISITGTDEIQDLPGNYGVPTAKPIVSGSNVAIDSDWASLMAQPILTPLQTATVLPAAQQWWSFSTATGALDANHCTNGTATGAAARTGDSSVTNTAWIFNLPTEPCTTPHYVLCVCY